MTPVAERPPSSRGFTLIELLISLALMTIVILAALMIFDFNSRLARVQTQVADMQQALRAGQYEIVRLLRMAGRGGLPNITPNFTFPRGAAVEIRNNVGTGGSAPPREIAIGLSGSPLAVQGTDVLTVRGVFAAPIYQVNSANAGTLVLRNGGSVTTDPTLANNGALQICPTTPSGVTQDLEAIRTAITDNAAEALIITSPLGEEFYAVVELLPVSSNATDASTCPSNAGVTIAFQIHGTTNSNLYRRLGPLATATGLSPQMTSIAFVGILEEYRYYVREEFAVAGDDRTEIAPRLSMARMFPGTELPYAGNDANLSIDITDGNIADLQVAFGFDTDGDGVVTNGTTTANMATDEWLWNVGGDDPSQARWTTVPGSAPPRRTPMYYARLSVLARTDRRDPNFQAQPLVAIEDRDYSGSTEPANQREQRMFRRRVLQTVVDLRNLS